MTPSPPHVRCERKFLLWRLSLPEALASVRRHQALFRQAYPPRFVNNVYFDSPDLRDYHDHVQGVAHRAKHRVRWYGPLEGRIAAPVFERKLKQGLVSGKVTVPLPALFFNGGGARALHAALLADAGMPEAVRRTLRQLEPSLINRYHRHYFVSADGRLRLTLDADLCFFSAHNGAGSNAGQSLRELPLVLELKFAPLDTDHAAAMTNALPYRLQRCSKYVLGLECLHAAHPAL
jgi:hypothetical protein